MDFRRNAFSGTPRKTSNANNSGIWIEEDSVENDFGRQRNSTMKAADESSILTTMSFASLQISECKPPEGEDDVDRKTFEQWRNVLESAMKIVGISDETTKSNVFKMKAGPKLIDVLENTSCSGAPDEELFPYSHIMFRLREFYGSRDYTLLQRQKLRATIQTPGEADIKYVQRVAAVAKLCDYSSEQLVETVADVIQSHGLNVKVREAGRKMLRKGGTLQELMDRVRAADIERQNEELYARNHPQPKPTAEVAAVAYSSSFPSRNYGRGFIPNSRGRGGTNRGRGGGNRAGGGTGPNRTPCWRCTSNFHLPERCPGIEKFCYQCDEQGHIGRACPKQRRFKRSGDEETGSSKVRKIAAVSAGHESAEDVKEEKDVSDPGASAN